jgi:hypothetical protein
MKKIRDKNVSFVDDQDNKHSSRQQTLWIGNRKNRLLEEAQHVDRRRPV